MGYSTRPISIPSRTSTSSTLRPYPTFYSTSRRSSLTDDWLLATAQINPQPTEPPDQYDYHETGIRENMQGMGATSSRSSARVTSVSSSRFRVGKGDCVTDAPFSLCHVPQVAPTLRCSSTARASLSSWGWHGLRASSSGALYRIAGLGGHDPEEDAGACTDLLKAKIKNSVSLLTCSSRCD